MRACVRRRCASVHGCLRVEAHQFLVRVAISASVSVSKSASVYLALPLPLPRASSCRTPFQPADPGAVTNPDTALPAACRRWWLSQRASALGVRHLGMRAHAELAGAMARASFYLYPTNFPETSCIALMQVRDSLPITPTLNHKPSSLPHLKHLNLKLPLKHLN